MKTITKRPTVKVDYGNLRFAYDMRGFQRYSDLARAAGVSPATVGHLLNTDPRTRRTTCDPTTAQKIAKALDVKPDRIFLYELYPVAGTQATA